MGNAFGVIVDLAATNALITTVDTVVDAIRAVDVPALDAVVDTVKVDTADIRTDMTAVHDVDLPAVKTVDDAIKVVTDGLADVKYLGPTGYSLSDVVLFSNDAEKTNGVDDAAVLGKEMICALGGTIRVHHEMKRSGTGNACNSQIYKNGISFGSIRSTINENYQLYDEDLAFVAGDLIQLYFHKSGNATCHIRNFRILGGWQHNFENTLE